ncbi:MAG: hypothetical protein COT84_03785 [Chlamydiae bacterium CG10_big_fil_rev_8_21_14_0_10_35_9]|nr:MAG: hypothetical protein COT84_03785 [Chlamydiae bacterium CG10_big_fil_rev_8_21_14_0_10_35_9]
MKKLLTLILVLAMISCGKSPNKNTLNISYSIDPPTFDPRKTGHFVDSTMSFKLFAGLSSIRKDGSVGPGLAKSYEVNKDRTVYTFHLRDAVWSDSTPITAYDFEKSWKKIIDPTFPSLTSKLFFCIKNAEKAANNKVPIDEVKINALDEKTLRVELEYPTPYFISLTAFCAYYPAPSHIVEKDPTWAQNPKEDFVCSGPFKMIKWTPKKEIIVEKNPLYWDKDNVKLEKIRIYIVNDQNTALQMFEQNELDLIGTPVSPMPFHAEAAYSNNERLKKMPIAGTAFITFNTKYHPLSNSNIRKAISYSIDRDLLVKTITYSNQTPAKRLIPPPLEDNLGDYLIPNHNKELAQKFLQKGLEELNLKKEDISITLNYPNNDLDKKTSEAIQRQIKDSIGLDIKIVEQDFVSHMGKVRAHKHQMAIARWIFQYNDMMNIYARFSQESDPVNYSQWVNNDFVALLDRANNLSNQKQRYQALLDAEKIFMDDLPVAPLYHLNYLMMNQKQLKNVIIGEVGDIHFHFAQLDQEVL